MRKTPDTNDTTRVVSAPLPVKGPYIIRFQEHVELLAIEEVLDAIALVKYGSPPDEEDEPLSESYWMAVEVDKTSRRDEVERALRDGSLIDRSIDGSERAVHVSSSCFEPMDGIYVERSEMVAFAAAKWMVKIQNGKPAIAGAGGSSQSLATEALKEVAPSRSEPWQESARRIADELQARDIASGAHSSLVDMGDRVATEMRRRNIQGPMGPLSGATVKREALQGGKWMRQRGGNQPGEPGEMGEG